MPTQAFSFTMAYYRSLLTCYSIQVQLHQASQETETSERAGGPVSHSDAREATLLTDIPGPCDLPGACFLILQSKAETLSRHINMSTWMQDA